MDFVRKHGLVKIVGFLALLVGVFALGRHFAPTKVEYREKERVVVHVDQTRILELEEQLRESQKKVTELQQKIKRTSTKVTRPDGTTEETKTEEIDTNTKTEEEKVKYVDRVVKVVEIKEVEVVKEKEVVKLVERDLPDWRIGPVVSVDPANLSVGYGGEVQRRLFDLPLNVGASVTKEREGFRVQAGLNLEF